MNSRPLMPLSNDPNDLYALTPSHFLIGESLTSLPQEDVRYIAENRLKHFKHLQQQVQHFWQRWSKQYITTLQERSKWHTRSANIEVGALVLVKDDNAPPLCGNLGRIVEVIPGDDNIVRVVCVETKHGVLKRPIAKICALPFSDS